MTKSDNEERFKIGISQGDINGIGYEIIIKTLANPRVMEICTPIVYGSSKVASYHRKTLDVGEFNLNLVKNADAAISRRANIINIYDKEVKIDLGMSTEVGGQLSLMSLEAAVEDLKHDHIDALVTAPINKKNIQSQGFKFPGHTEYLAEKFNTKDFLMLMVSNNIRIGVVTGHIPLKDVSNALTEELILNKIKILNESLLKDFGIRKGRIAVLGVNPHSGDNGVIGDEENKIIIPAIKKAKEAGILAFGPYPADGFFGSSSFTKFDAVIAMYHDQGLIPFKTLTFDSGVNYTAGLPIVRTSPAHGTAYELAGKNIASADSFREALYLAIDICRNRRLYNELTVNPLKFTVHDEEKPGSEPKLVL
ncbi:MAG TPA: 4-hydroxythreonine-4-phosphate dehydrogenase PdxA [Bacteroidales bacterium]|nr:4-hydroxythreonine-4-phosphate dehydrogenase PdxA [Bacteroidales bacterium]HPS16150.1 4-hydroxythreonine-4-phosphate dehydrogenase PdxA [Bacteroidales bacterium]